MDRFLNSLVDHSTGERSATKPWDYVISVWADCPRYTIPANYKSMAVLELLEDAICQFETKEAKTFATTCPYGLLGGTKHTLCWRPNQGLQSKRVKRSRHLYAPARTDLVLPLRNNFVPLKKSGETSRSISSRAEDYETCCRTLSTAEMLYYMVRVVRNWNVDSRGRLSTLKKEGYLTLYQHSAIMQELNDEGEASDSQSLAEFERHFLDAMGSPEQAPDVEIADYRLLWQLEEFPELDHHTLVYRVVAYILGLDYEACIKAGICLVIAPEAPAMIGLIAGDLGIHTGNALSGNREETLTVWTGSTGAQKILYEGIRHNDDAQSVPQYRVTGIWIPCRDVKESDIGAILSFDNEYDAVVV
jgi:hypothetical protein